MLLSDVSDLGELGWNRPRITVAEIRAPSLWPGAKQSGAPRVALRAGAGAGAAAAVTAGRAERAVRAERVGRVAAAVRGSRDGVEAGYGRDVLHILSFFIDKLS